MSHMCAHDRAGAWCTALHAVFNDTGSSALDADAAGSCELHLLDAPSLKLICRQQLPPGCTAATLSPNSCCLASVHQLGSVIADKQCAHRPTDLSGGLQDTMPVNPAYQSGVAKAEDNTAQIGAKSGSHLESVRGGPNASGTRAGQKRKRGDLPASSIICFHSLAGSLLQEEGLETCDATQAEVKVEHAADLVGQPTDEAQVSPHMQIVAAAVANAVGHVIA